MSTLVDKLEKVESIVSETMVVVAVFNALLAEKNNDLNENEKDYFKYRIASINNKLKSGIELNNVFNSSADLPNGFKNEIVEEMVGQPIVGGGEVVLDKVDIKPKKASKDPVYDALYFGAVYQSKSGANITIDRIYRILQDYNENRLIGTFKSIMSRHCSGDARFTRDKNDYYSITSLGEGHISALLKKILDKDPDANEDVRMRLKKEFGESFIELPK